MVKKRIIVKGNVQGVGYRALVKLIARSLVVKGRIRNLDDGTVEMFCEGEVGVLARFLSTIDIKRRNGNLLAIDVKEMEEHQEGTDGYGKGTAPREFKAFEIDYGQDLTLADQEMLERQELLIVGGSQVLDGLGIVGEKVDIVGQKVDKGFSELGHKVDGVGKNVKDLGEKVNVVGHNVIGMHGDMNEKFMKMEKKYHMINENIERSNKNVEKMIKDNARTNENLRRLIEKGDKVDRNIARMNKSLEMTSRALVKLIEKDIVERRKARTAIKKR
jgi:acylphosphatase